jgi:hypothetical protein
MDNWNKAKKIIGILLFIALLPFTAFNILLVCIALVRTQYIKTLIIFVLSLGLLVWFQIIFWRLFRGQQSAKRFVSKDPQVIRCQCCGGSNRVSGKKLGRCQYCSVKLRFGD